MIPDRVLTAMHRASANIYDGDLPDMVPGIIDDLKVLAGTSGNAAMYIANGHGTWEAAISNVFSRGDLALVPSTGRFAEGWALMAQHMGIKTDVMDFGNRAPIDPARVEERLRADKGHQIRAVMCVQVDTSTSVRNDIKALRDVLDRTGHPALLMVDCIASFGCDRFEMDAWGVDVMVSASQKGLMTPPGLGFVFYNQKADGYRDTANALTHYWDWRPRTAPDEFYKYFDGTAATHHLYGLREALDMIAEEGRSAVFARHARLSQAVWAAFDVWGQQGPLQLNITNPDCRAHSVTSVHAGSDKGTALRKWLEFKAGVTLGIGLGMADPSDPKWHHFFRVGHMGHVNTHMVMGALGAIEAGLRAVEIPFQTGGLSAAAEVLSTA